MISMKLVDELHAAFLFAYVFFAIGCAIRWFLGSARLKSGARSWFGVAGLAAGLMSATLYLVFSAFFLMEQRLLAHGSHLWLYYYAGELLGTIGCLAGLFGRDWVRPAALFVSLTMLFEWWRRMVPSVKAGTIITVLMFISLTILGICLLGRRLMMYRTRRG